MFVSSTRNLEACLNSRILTSAAGTKIPALGLGTFEPGPPGSGRCSTAVKAGILAGYRHIDTAALYGEDVSAVFAHEHPDGLADPIYTARTHLFLASDDAKEINGQVLIVDGGASNLHP